MQRKLAATFLALATASTVSAQSITLPPSGNNQKASVTQHIGLVRVTIEYSSPRVISPAGEDRHGKIWGTLVPYGMHDLGFNNRRGPWRAGANENTVFEVSHPVKVQGQRLPAGRYGLHMIAGEREFTVVFSKNSTSWGSFSYDEAEDALRVTAVPEKAPYREYLTYEFTERKLDRASVALEWDELRIPFTIEVEDAVGLYLDSVRRELRNAQGFNWMNLDAAAQFCLQQNRNLEEALQWSENSMSPMFGGQPTFNTLSTKAQILEKMTRTAEAREIMATALGLPGANPLEIHQYGRRLIAQGKKDEALAVFKKNRERFGDTWPVHVGLARGYSAVGDYKTALEHAEIAMRQAPDTLNKKNLEAAVIKLKQGKDMNAGG